MNADHPLLQALRDGLLWHCTSVGNYRRILRDGAIKPQAVTDANYEARYCCHELNAISVFDFLTPSVAQILNYTQWRDCLARHFPVTVALGFSPESVAANLIRYPDMKEVGGKKIQGAVLPHVEACHVGDIPLRLVVRYLLICPADWSRFYIETAITEESLAGVAAEFEAECQRQQTEFPAPSKALESLNAMIEARRKLDGDVKERNEGT